MKTISLDRIKALMTIMLTMQDALNKKVFSDWRERDLAWHRAIYVEAAEYLEHMATWKWWKKGEPDFPQANMELVDIWHFGLSWQLTAFWRGDMDALVELCAHKVAHTLALQDRIYGELDINSIEPEMRYAQVDALVCAAGDQSFDLPAFMTLLKFSGMDFEELYRRYVGKNALNVFRQAHGYKTGAYVKVWDGREDNVHLHEILESLPADENLPGAVSAELEARYSKAVA